MIRSGWLYKKKRSSFFSLFGEWNKRYAICDGITLVIYTDRQPKWVIEVKDMESIQEEDGVMVIATPYRSFLLRADTEQNQLEWMTVFRNASYKYLRVDQAKAEWNQYHSGLKARLRIDVESDSDYGSIQI